MYQKALKSYAVIVIVLLTGLSLLAGCRQRDTITKGETQETSVFSFDQAAFSEAKPWTSEEFKNNPANFQFAVLGDRGGRGQSAGHL